MGGSGVVLRRVVAVGIVLASLALVGCGPGIESQGKWAAAACEANGGVITFDDFDSEGSGAGQASVICGNGAHFEQREFGEDEGCPESEGFCWETPAQVRKRAR